MVFGKGMRARRGGIPAPAVFWTCHAQKSPDSVGKQRQSARNTSFYAGNRRVWRLPLSAARGADRPPSGVSRPSACMPTVGLRPTVVGLRPPLRSGSNAFVTHSFDPCRLRLAAPCRQGGKTDAGSAANGDRDRDPGLRLGCVWSPFWAPGGGQLVGDPLFGCQGGGH